MNNYNANAGLKTKPGSAKGVVQLEGQGASAVRAASAPPLCQQAAVMIFYTASDKGQKIR